MERFCHSVFIDDSGKGDLVAVRKYVLAASFAEVNPCLDGQKTVISTAYFPVERGSKLRIGFVCSVYSSGSTSFTTRLTLNVISLDGLNTVPVMSAKLYNANYTAAAEYENCCASMMVELPDVAETTWKVEMAAEEENLFLPAFGLTPRNMIIVEELRVDDFQKITMDA